MLRLKTERDQLNICAFSLLLHLQSKDVRVCVNYSIKILVFATSTFLQVPVQVPVLGMQVQVQILVPENCT